MGSTSEKSSLLQKSSVGDAQGFAEAFGLAQDYLASRSRASDLYWMVNPKEFQEANKRVHEVVDHYVNLALKSQKEKPPGSRYIFAEALAAETSDSKVLRDNMLNILLAGRDTTASLLSSAFYYMARHPHVWNRLRREIVEQFGDASQPKAEITQVKLKDIPYLRYVLNESTSIPHAPITHIANKTSPPSSTPRPPQLPRRKQRHHPPRRWRTKRKIPRLRTQRLHRRIQRLRHA